MNKNMPKTQRRKNLYNRGQINAVSPLRGGGGPANGWPGHVTSLTAGTGTSPVWGFPSLAFAQSLLLSKCHFCFGLVFHSARTQRRINHFPQSWIPISEAVSNSVFYNKSIILNSVYKRHISSNASALTRSRPQKKQDTFFKKHNNPKPQLTKICEK